jgi:hypothetical protein
MDSGRRQWIAGAAAATLALPAWVGRAFAAEAGGALPLPPLAEVGGSGATLL